MQPLCLNTIRVALSELLLDQQVSPDVDPWLECGVVIDSRQVQPGDVFWALPGTQTHGARFIEDAIRRGAGGIVTEVPSPLDSSVDSCESATTTSALAWTLTVPDSLQALWQLAAQRRDEFEGQVIAVTGSVGKTTTRRMMDAVLSAWGPGTTSPANYNNHVGLPLSMLRLESRHRYAVWELGASAPGEIAQLAALCRPHVAVITGIAEAHLEGFGSLEAVAATKCELLEHLFGTDNHPSGEDLSRLAILNGDDPYLRKRVKLLADQVTWTGRGVGSDVQAAGVRYHEGLLQFSVGAERYEVPVWGRHHLTAAVMAVTLGNRFGLSAEQIRTALGRFENSPRRCQVHRTDGLTLIDDTYNANPRSMAAALQLLADTETSGRRIAILADMAEQGSSAQQAHRALGAAVVEKSGADLLLTLGAFSSDMISGAVEAGMPRSAVWRFDSQTDLTEALLHDMQLTSGDTLMFKGCRAMQLDKVVDSLLAQTAGDQPTQPNIISTTTRLPEEILDELRLPQPFIGSSIDCD